MANDILMSVDNDILFHDGDFFIGDSGDQHVQHILTAEKGQYYANPLVGIGIKKYINGPFDRVQLAREIREQLQSDGFNIRRLFIGKNTDQLEIDVDAVVKDNTAI